MQIGNLNLNGRVLCAPLAGVSSRPFRVLARQYRAAMVFTEMVSSEGIIRDQERTLSFMEFGPDEQPIGIQLFGANPEVMKQATEITARDFAPDLIDINFGCPVRKVVNKNGGAAALKDLGRTAEIMAAVVAGAGDIPVSVKIRTGWDEQHPVYLEVGRIAEACGVAAITLHARSRSRGFSGAADWTTIARLKEAVGIPVIGNGDLCTPEDARRMIDETGCDAVMVGRAIMGNPLLLAQMDHYLETGTLLPEPGPRERLAAAVQHARLMIETHGDARGALKMRKFLAWYVKGFRGAATLRPRLMQVSSMADIEAVLEEYIGSLESNES
jgi:nifR3 family TIM-barrel protein